MATRADPVADDTVGDDGDPLLMTRGQMAPDWVLVGAAEPKPPDTPIHRRRVLVQVGLGALAVIILVALVGVVAARRLAEAEAVHDAAETADLIAESLVQPVITDGLLTGDPAALKALDQAVQDHVLSDSIVRVKVWDPAGRILFSDEPLLIGQSFPLGEDERDVLSDPQIRADVSDLQAPENLYERDSGKLLEAYRPVWTPAGQPLLFEAYFRYDEVTARSAELWRGFAGVTLSSILLLVVLLTPILWRLLDRLKLAQAQREALLQRAIDASTEERRRIAGTLHDGVVQDLVATSFAVSGSAERAAAIPDPGLADDLRRAAGTVRTSIGGLRSLLVDIYPPSLSSAGLAAALQDLATSLRSRDIGVRVELAEVGGLDAATERLIYRVAQECLINVMKHAAATTVAIAVRVAGGVTELDIIDDGSGFDVEKVLARPVAGHFGLRVLGDVAADAGAELRVWSAVGEGTKWRLRVPK
jgi:two-component system NarL family sensor kinase